MTEMKTWAESPSRDEVRAYLQTFFDELRAGRLEASRAMVAHAYPDWDETIYTVFQDHYLIHEAPADSSYEGRVWDTDRAWLADLTAQPGGEWMGKDGNVLWIDLAYRGEPSGYIAEFAIKRGDAGFYVERSVFRMA